MRYCLKEDIEYCLNYASKTEELIKQLRSLGYEIDTVRMSVKAKGWQRSVRLSSIGFSSETINACLLKNSENVYFYSQEWNTHLPFKPKRFPLKSEMRRLEFSIEHSHNTATILIDTMFLLILTVIKITQNVSDAMLLSPDLRHAAKDFKNLYEDYNFFKENDIHTIPHLSDFAVEIKMQISELERMRNKISNQIRRPKSENELAVNKERRKKITKQIQPLRKKLRMAERILEKSPHLYDMLRQEYMLEESEMRRQKIKLKNYRQSR